MTSQLQRPFSKNITTLCRRLLIAVFFEALLQRRDIVERRCDIKTTTLQLRHDVVCLLGFSSHLAISQKKLQRSLWSRSIIFEVLQKKDLKDDLKGYR